jgi:hypothetical protein
MKVKAMENDSAWHSRRIRKGGDGKGHEDDI